LVGACTGKSVGFSPWGYDRHSRRGRRAELLPKYSSSKIALPPSYLTGTERSAPAPLHNPFLTKTLPQDYRPDGPGCPVPNVLSLSTRAAQGCGVGRSSQWTSARQPCAYQVAAPNGSIAEGADQTGKRNRKAVRDDRCGSNIKLSPSRWMTRPDNSKLPPQKNRRWVMSLSAREGFSSATMANAPKRINGEGASWLNGTKLFLIERTKTLWFG